MRRRWLRWTWPVYGIVWTVEDEWRRIARRLGR